MITLNISAEVQAALKEKRPVVALESTVISHGLPWPDNLELARTLEAIIREQGAVPATIALIAGQPTIGLDDKQLELLANGRVSVEKISRRDFGYAIARKLYGATTVAATMILAHKAGIDVFATGGIGGVHRGDSNDISADLPEFAQTPVVVVSAGAKAILDLPRTLEWLETYGVPVIGYETNEFPAFYTRASGLSLPYRADTPAEVAAIISAQWSFGLKSGILVANPVPHEAALPLDETERYIQQALLEAQHQGVHGKALTPFLLAYLADISDGKTKQTNLALLKNNAKVGAQIAIALKEQREMLLAQ